MSFYEYLILIWLQVPLAIVTAKFVSGKGGNIVVWLTLILGQPVAILAYVHDYYVRNVGGLRDQTFSINWSTVTTDTTSSRSDGVAEKCDISIVTNSPSSDVLY